MILNKLNSQRVHIIYYFLPGLKGGVNHTYGGDVDVRPTVMHLLGLDTKDYIDFGTDFIIKRTSASCTFLVTVTLLHLK